MECPARHISLVSRAVSRSQLATASGWTNRPESPRKEHERRSKDDGRSGLAGACIALRGDQAGAPAPTVCRGSRTGAAVLGRRWRSVPGLLEEPGDVRDDA